MSTPNRITFSPGRDTPLNPFHTRELNAAELTELLRRRRLRDRVDARRVPRPAAASSSTPATAARSSTPRSPARWPTRRGPTTCSPTSPSVTTDDFDLIDAARPRHRRQPGPRRHRGAPVSAAPTGQPVPGLFTLVLHTHLPWLAHHGRWPVGEEWLYQSWAAAYLPLMRVLRTLAAEGRSHLVTLGMTPVVTAQLDDPYCLAGMHHWLANWQLRALEAHHRTAIRTPPEALRAFGIREHAEAERALDDFATLWRHGGSPLLRELIDAGTIELLGGPLAHPFQPLLQSAAARVRAARGPGRRAAAVRPHARPASGRPNAPTRPGMETRLRRSGCRPLHGRRPVAARRHRAGPAGRRLRRRRVRPRPAGQLPGVVAEVRLSRARRLPRLPHLRPRHRAQAGPRHRPQRAVGRQGAV